ncbi:MAG: hypothetical protein ABSA01_09780, partial [Anaerolineales bacterium]
MYPFNYKEKSYQWLRNQIAKGYLFLISTDYLLALAFWKTSWQSGIYSESSLEDSKCFPGWLFPATDRCRICDLGGSWGVYFSNYGLNPIPEIPEIPCLQAGAYSENRGLRNSDQIRSCHHN